MLLFEYLIWRHCTANCSIGKWPEKVYASYYILLYLRKSMHNAADLLDAHIVPMRWDVHNIWWVEFEWWSKFWHSSWFPPMVRGTYEAFTSLDVWANIHVYGKQPFVLNVTLLFQIRLLPGSTQHPRTRALTGIRFRLLLFWVHGCPLEWPTDDEHDDETDAHFNAMGERFALPLLRSVLPCLQMRHLPEPS